MIKLIIFDWDDVFTMGSTNGYKKCYHEAVIGAGEHLSPDEEMRRINAKWGASHVEELRELMKDKPELLEKALEVYESHLFGDTFVDCLSVVPGSADFLEELSKEYTLALATGVHPKLLKERVMPKFGIDPSWFSQIITAYDLEDPSHAKPHAYSGRKIMEVQNVPAENTIMVGDARNDVLMARAAGIRPIVVLTGHLNKKQAEELGVEYIIDNVTHLKRLLPEL